MIGEGLGPKIGHLCRAQAVELNRFPVLFPILRASASAPSGLAKAMVPDLVGIFDVGPTLRSQVFCNIGCVEEVLFWIGKIRHGEPWICLKLIRKGNRHLDRNVISRLWVMAFLWTIFEALEGGADCRHPIHEAQEFPTL